MSTWLLSGINGHTYMYRERVYVGKMCQYPENVRHKNQLWRIKDIMLIEVLGRKERWQIEVIEFNYTD